MEEPNAFSQQDETNTGSHGSLRLGIPTGSSVAPSSATGGTIEIKRKSSLTTSGSRIYLANQKPRSLAFRDTEAIEQEGSTTAAGAASQPVTLDPPQRVGKMPLAEEGYTSLSTPKVVDNSTSNITTSSGSRSSNTLDRERGSFASIGSNSSRITYLANKIYRKLQEWGIIDLIMAGMESIMVQILFGVVCHWVVAGLLIILITVVFNLTLPYLSIYNLIQLFIGMLGKGLLMFAIYLHQVCAKSMVALNLTGTTSISDLTFKFGGFNPPQGRTMRRVFFLTLLATEASLWLLQLEMNWSPITGSLGFYDCSLPSYPDELTPYPALADYIQGDISYSPIYAFGLPLSDGLIGGAGSWPQAAPAETFASVGDGIVFVVGANCGPSVPVDGTYMSNSTATALSVVSDNLWPRLYAATLQVRYPAGSYVNPNGSIGHFDITQQCEIMLRVDAATISYTFFRDGWDEVSFQQIDYVEISLLNEPSYRITPRMEVTPFANEVHDMLDISYTPTHSRLDNTTLFQQFARWMADSVNHIFSNDTVCTGNAASKVCRMLHWGTVDGGQYYDLNRTDKGIASLVAVIGHFNLMQSSGNEIGSCQYWGQNGSGNISVAPGTVNLVLGLLGLTLFLEFCMVTQVYLAVNSTQKHVDLAARMLDDPLRLLYTVKSTIKSMITTMTIQDWGKFSLRQHLETVEVRLGEKKSSRGEAAGELSLGKPKDVLKLRKARTYI